MLNRFTNKKPVAKHEIKHETDGEKLNGGANGGLRGPGLRSKLAETEIRTGEIRFSPMEGHHRRKKLISPVVQAFVGTIRGSLLFTVLRGLIKQNHQAADKNSRNFTPRAAQTELDPQNTLPYKFGFKPRERFLGCVILVSGIITLAEGGI